MAGARSSAFKLINYTEYNLLVETRQSDASPLETIDLAPFGKITFGGYPTNPNTMVPLKLTVGSGPNQGAHRRFRTRQQDAFAGGDGIFTQIEFSNEQTSGNPGFMVYQVAHHEGNRIMVVPDYDLASWMSHVPLTRPIIEMLLPATHDSACIVGRGGTAISWTQDKDNSKIEDQLNFGIRAFDLRFQLASNGELISVHGPEDMKYAPSLIMEEIFKWLINHPTEFVLAKIRGDSNVAPKLWEAINDPTGVYRTLVYGIRANQNYVDDIWPSTLGACKGRLVIQTEGGLKNSFGGIQGPPWRDNTTDETVTIGGMQIRVQDEYNYHIGSFDQKWTRILDMLHNQQGSNKSMWYYNFLNASGQGFPSKWSNGLGLDWGMNRRLMAEFADNVYHTTGVIWLDYFREPMNLNALPRLIAALNSDAIRNRHWGDAPFSFPGFPIRIPQCPLQ
ncbi:hypothetical protein TWF281_000725 [Arthrobotrys megalospora]